MLRTTGDHSGGVSTTTDQHERERFVVGLLNSSQRQPLHCAVTDAGGEKFKPINKIANCFERAYEVNGEPADIQRAV